MPLLQRQDGTIVSVGDDEVNHAIGQGYTPVSTGEAAGSLTEREKAGQGVGGAIAAGLTSLASGATLGASDIALGGILPKGDVQALADSREAHPIVTGLGQTAGAIAASVAAPESLLGKTPQGYLARLAGEGVEAGKAIGGVKGALVSIGSSGLEGAAQNAGMYLSDVALGDRDLSAEGLSGALGRGFGFGSFAGGGVLAIEKGTMAARRMFARIGGKEAASDAESAFARKSDEVLTAHEDAANIARKRLDEIRAMKRDAQEMRMRADDEIARARVDEAAGPAQAAQGPAPFEWPAVNEPRANAAGTPVEEGGLGGLEKYRRVEPEAATPVVQPAPAAPTLEEQLAATKSKLDSGETLQSLRGKAKVPATEHPLGPAVAEEEQKLETALSDYDARRAKVNEWIEKYKNPRRVQDMEAPGLVRGRRYEALPEDVFVEQSGGQLRTIGKMEGTLQDLTPNSRILARSNGPDYWKGTELDEAYQDAVERATSATSREEAHAALNDAAAAEQKIHEYVRSHKPENAAVIDQIEALRRNAGVSGYESAAKRAGKLAEISPRNIVEQAHEATQVLGEYEKSAANLVEAVGDAAPPAAKQAAQAFREAESTSERKFMDRTARAVDDHADAVASGNHPLFDDPNVGTGKGLPETPGPLRETPAQRIANAKSAKLEANAKLTKLRLEEADAKAQIPSGKASGGLKKEVEAPAAAGKPGKFQRMLHVADKVGQGLEIASMAGVPGIPAPHDIPVIGPLLGMFLKFKALSSKLMGRVPATADAKAAALAARTQERAALAVDRMLGLVEKAAPKARSVAVATSRGAGEYLTKRIFDDGHPDAPKDASAPEMVAVRAREVAAAASNPQAVIAQVRKELKGITDPDLISSAEQQKLREVKYLNDKAPKEPPPSPFVKSAWMPNGVDTAEFMRRLAVAHDPIVAIEQVEQRCITPEAAETLQAVYPKLFAQIQQQLVSRAGEVSKIPYDQVLRMSMLFGVALDPMLEPDTFSLLQSVHAPASKSPAAPAQTTPPTPSVAGPVDLGKLYSPQFSRVARS